MMKGILLVVAFTNVVVNAVFLNPPPSQGGGEGVGGGDVGDGPPPAYTFLKGKLAAVNPEALQFVGENDGIVKKAAVKALGSVLGNYMAATGDEVVKATSQAIPPVDPDGNIHVRFRQYVKGHAVEGASMVMHIRGKDGSVYAFNGEFSPANAIDLRVELACNEAVDIALAQFVSGDGGIAKNSNGVEWLSETCEEAAVRGFGDGLAHLAYKRLVGYQPEDKDMPYQRTMLFASTLTGDLLAWHPQTRNERSLETWDCKMSWGYCRVKSNSSNPITSGNRGIIAAHNYAIATYDFFKSEYGRDSMDDAGMKIVSFANSGTDNNAWWDGYAVSYGGGDGVKFYPWSMGADVVAHEITHGITQFSSNLIYWEESGAINEAMSDIFGAVVERTHLNKSVADTWLIAEDVFIQGGAIRNMQDPTAFDNVDYYPDRYLEWDDNGGVHNNSGIGNLAFALMVQGGSHPRNKTNITVPALIASDFDASLKAAAAIFYYANTQCLSESSTFDILRMCTMLFAGEHESSVDAAWKAVGVGGRDFTKLQNGVEVTDQSATDWNEVLAYFLDGVKEGECVTCVTEADNGDADLFIRLNAPADPHFGSYLNDCSSGFAGSNEECTTRRASTDTTAFAAVQAYEEFSDMDLSCFRTPVGSLFMGTPITGQQGTVGDVQYYAIDFYLYEGVQIKCVTFGTNGDADLFFKFGSLPSPFHDSSNDCESITDGSSEESCAANYMFKGIVSSQSFAAVYSSEDYDNLTILCNRFYPPFTIFSGQPYEYLYITLGTVQQMVIEGVQAGEIVNCTLDSDAVGADVDLYVRFGQEAEPYPWSTANDCMSLGPQTSDETCQTAPTPVATSAYVALSRTKVFGDYYYGVEASLTCTAGPPPIHCLPRGAICTKPRECCSDIMNRTYACDGPKGRTRTCKPCLRANKRCTRSSQCCSGAKCLNKRCKKTKK